MVQTIKHKLAIAVSMLALAMPFAAPVTVAAQTSPDIGANVSQGACLSTDPADCPQGDADEGVNNLIRSIINIFSIIVGIIAVIMIIIGGLKYIMSGGNDKNVSGAKNTILYAVVGLIIVALAQLIVRFVLSKATAVN